MLLCGLFSPAAFADTAIQRENALPGTSDWQRRVGGDISVYGSAIGVAPGDRIEHARQHGVPLPAHGLPARLVRGSRRAAHRLRPRLRHRRAGTASQRPLNSGGPDFDGPADPRRLARDRRHSDRLELDERLLHHRSRPHERAGQRTRRHDVLRRARERAAVRVAHPRPGSRQHVGGVQPLGRQEPLRLLRPARVPRLLRSPVRRDGADADVVGDPARALPRARGLRRLVPDRRRHRRRPRQPAPPPRSSSTPATTSTGRAGCATPSTRRSPQGTNLAFMGSNDAYWQDQVRGRRPHDLRLQVALRPERRCSPTRRRCSARSAARSAC